jgi:prepilin-type processing-associated H-X9-DG protein/prepilin-type N-terminal cleavage/methylation domain-containing protein
MSFSWVRLVRLPSRRQHREGGVPGWSGFTLVELLVVVAVTALLAGLLLPVVARVQEHARQISCLSRLHQIATAHRLYMDDWDETLQPYLCSDDVWRDPNSSWTGPRLASTKVADYVLLAGGRTGKGTREEPYGVWPGPPLTAAQVVRPAETVTVMDGITTTQSGGADEERHRGGMNVAFVDGHLVWLRSGELYRVDTTAAGFWYYRYWAADR